MADLDLDAMGQGYALNKLAWSLNRADNRADFLADEDGYCARYGLSDVERAAVRNGDKQGLRGVGGNPYFLAKLDRTWRIAGDPRRADDAVERARLENGNG